MLLTIGQDVQRCRLAALASIVITSLFRTQKGTMLPDV